MHTVVEGIFFLTCALHSSSSHTTWDEKHFQSSQASTINSKNLVQCLPGKTRQFQFKKHKRKIEVEIERKRLRKTGK